MGFSYDVAGGDFVVERVKINATVDVNSRTFPPAASSSSAESDESEDSTTTTTPVLDAGWSVRGYVTYSHPCAPGERIGGEVDFDVSVGTNFTTHGMGLRGAAHFYCGDAAQPTFTVDVRLGASTRADAVAGGV